MNNMQCQRHLFELPDDVHYLNGAYMSPLMKTVQEAGIKGIQRKANPASIMPLDFFSQAETVKATFAQLVNVPAKQVALVPSASYGLKSAINNIPLDTGDHAIVVAHEFPSGFNTIRQWCIQNDKALKIIEAPSTLLQRGAEWNNDILNAINGQTSAVVISSVHWADGTRFDLSAIGRKCKQANALLIVDGTQSVGALPMDATGCWIDALVCAGYKWLMGPYSTGVAYYSEAFNNGVPVEESWINRCNAEDFTKLNSYEDAYKPGAARFSVGESGNFILLPMLQAGLQQLTYWGIDAIQEYCRVLIQPLIELLHENNCWVEEGAYRTNHLFGFLLPPGADKAALLALLQQKKVIVSVRGDAIRVSPNVYNTEENVAALMNVLKNQFST